MLPSDMKDFEADGGRLLTPKQALIALGIILVLALFFDAMGWK